MLSCFFLGIVMVIYLFMESVRGAMKAFTLIELSIVLIIISLIVGGVVGGQSLVHSAKVNQMGNDITTQASMVLLFKDQYDFYPGDLPNAQEYWPDCLDLSGVTCNGNGDNIITETLRAYEHLYRGGFLDTQYLFQGSSADYYDYSYKPPIYGSNTYAMISTLDGLSPAIYNTTGHNISIISRSNYISSADIKRIDKKIDDGFASSGKIMAFFPSDPRYRSLTTCVSGSSSDINSTYLLANKSTACTINLWFN